MFEKSAIKKFPLAEQQAETLLQTIILSAEAGSSHTHDRRSAPGHGVGNIPAAAAAPAAIPPG